MTESAEGQRCRWCGRGIDRRPGPGRPREFCKPSCRQADYVARQRRTEVGLSEHELIVARDALDALRDRIYVLEAAIEDVERDLEAAEGERDVREALAWLLDSARPWCSTPASISRNRHNQHYGRRGGGGGSAADEPLRP